MHVRPKRSRTLELRSGSELEPDPPRWSRFVPPLIRGLLEDAEPEASWWVRRRFGLDDAYLSRCRLLNFHADALLVCFDHQTDGVAAAIEASMAYCVRDDLADGEAHFVDTRLECR